MNSTIINQNLRQQANIVYICDENYVMPTAVSMYSLIQNKQTNTHYNIYLICSSISSTSVDYLTSFAKDDVQINVIHQDINIVTNLHTFIDNAPCVASVSALLKFYLPELLQNIEKVLYLDGDLLVLEDITHLYNTELGDSYLAAVVDSGVMYTRNIWIDKVEHYFNSGVMLLNLKQMRKEHLTRKLVQCKQDLNDSTLMDQNIFNITCDQRIKLLPIRYNLLHVNLTRAKESWTVSQLNEQYGCSYCDTENIFSDAAIIHFSSKDKPWKNASVIFADKWFHYYFDISCHEVMQPQKIIQLLFVQFSESMSRQKQLNALLLASRNENVNIKKRLQSAWDRNAELTKKLTASWKEIDEKNKKLLTALETNKELKEKLNSAWQQNEDKKQRLQAAWAHHSDLKEKLNSAWQQNEEKKERLQEAWNRNAELSSKLQATQEELLKYKK